MKYQTLEQVNKMTNYAIKNAHLNEKRRETKYLSSQMLNTVFEAALNSYMYYLIQPETEENLKKMHEIQKLLGTLSDMSAN